MLKYGGGYDAFCQRYGDYFVAGFRLRGDTGFLLSTSKFSRRTVETYKVTATVTVLFLEGSESWSKDLRDYSSGKALSLLGYDTLSQKNWNVTTTKADFWAFQEQKDQVLYDSEDILYRAQEALDKRGLRDGQFLTGDECRGLFECGLVIELMLLPMSSLRDVARWRSNNNII